MLFEMYYDMLNVWFLQLMPATFVKLELIEKPIDNWKKAMQMWKRMGIAICQIIMATTNVDLASEEPF